MVDFIEKINTIVWGPGTIILILFCGVYFTFATEFLQIRNFGAVIKEVFRPARNKASFRALSAALAGTVGTGNIAGVATSIALGGPGAVFWMIASSFLGMMTKYAEVVLAVKYQIKNKNGTYSGGPMYYMENGLGLRFLGIIFAFLLAVSALGIGNMVQANSVSEAFFKTFGISPALTGFILILVCAKVILGGSGKILNATEIIVPVMAAFYLAGTLIFLALNFSAIPSALKLIFADAFSTKSLTGGVGGFTVSKAVKYGVSRGVFTNEAGLGSSPVAHASVYSCSPARQGLWGIFEVFFDTVIMCTLTALVILVGGLKTDLTGYNGIELTSRAFGTIFGNCGETFITVSIFFFAVATIFGWCLYGEKAVLYLSGENKTALKAYKILYIFAIYIGATLSLETVWTLSDIFNGLMSIPNIVTLFLLRKQALDEKLF